VPFKRGFYTVDVKFFIKVTLDFFVPRSVGGVRIITVPGLVVFDKKVILFGSEGNVKIFKSHYVENGIDNPGRSSLQQDNLPIAKVEVAEPICLNSKIETLLEKCIDDIRGEQLPKNVEDMLEEVDFDASELAEADDSRHHHHEEHKIVVATIGLFSIVKLARLVQLLIPAFDFCIPNKRCLASTNENPCELFETIEFPTDEFFPPQKFDFPGAEEEEKHMHRENDEG
jgi:hypothetical protein